MNGFLEAALSHSGFERILLRSQIREYCGGFFCANSLRNNPEI